METTNFIHDATEIYKYIGYKRVETLFNEQYLYCRDITQWPDMMELFLDKIVNKTTPKYRYGLCWTLHHGIERIVDTKNRSGALEEIKRNGVEAMWVNYCHNGGVRIKTTIGKVRECMNNFCRNGDYEYKDGLVIYENYNATTIDRIDDLCFSKQPNFYTDDEYRFVITSKKPAGEALHIDIVNMHNFIDEILISPAKPSDRTQVENLNKIVDKYTGFCFPIPNSNKTRNIVTRKSVLYGRW